MSRIYLVIFLLSTIFSTSVLGQEKGENTWMHNSTLEILESMGIQYQKPHGFQEAFGIECFDDNPKLKNAFKCLDSKLISEDKECVIFIPTYRILTKEDSIRINKILKGSIKSLNNFHINNARVQIKALYKDENLSGWKNEVTYFSSKDAKKKFNADTAIYYSLRLNPDVGYKKRFNNIYSLFLQKKDKGFVNIIVFYSDKIKDDIEKKLIHIEKTIKYKG